MKTIILVMMFMTQVSVAQSKVDGTGSFLGDNNNVNNCNVKCESKVVLQTKTQQDKIKELEEKVAELQHLLSIKATYVPKIKEVEVDARKNSVSFLAGVNPTKLVTETTPSSLKSHTEYEADFGLMYQRDLSRKTRFSIGVTVQGAGLLGIGYNF